MLTILLHRTPARAFYRVEISDNLFGEYTVLREWGRGGRAAGARVNWFSNLRDAVQAADRWRGRAISRGYRLSERRTAQG
ncbi:WGR domain-containing protein [Rhodobacter sp. 140A]|jgi:predicted DNA-binding WGR domain protein|uniref:WGR domain-containing protein n=2 Tax=root TaxID=1 RepID=A0A443LUH4_9RHOB|nr:WGR domain-containing protein [Sinirhodobacter huangdaonensis]RBP97072.1 WGR domain-containing protein [Rhodobacter sp. 140A]RWR52842.1 WGR domain-containing protein [Sinirhodobacter huangdaonensis]